MVPMREAKGAALVLMVEILAAALSASHFGFEASSFFTAEGPSPNIGQLIISIDPGPASTGLYYERMEALLSTILNQQGTRLPGANRSKLWQKAEQNGINVREVIYNQLLQMKL